MSQIPVLPAQPAAENRRAGYTLEKLNCSPNTVRISAAVGSGLVVFLWEAMPEWIPSRTVRIAAKTTLVVGATAASVLLGDLEMQQEKDLEEGLEQEEDPREAIPQKLSEIAEPTQWFLVAGGVLLMVASSVGGRKVSNAITRRLSDRGFSHPRTVLAAGSGVLAALTTYADSRKS
ncbi:hypothetical protein SAMN05421595_0427 [Austwickia chelonae]|uniref:Uncharacterized protein n=1 Tax=Austwickia chelonae NBRC 105200 TaxID=1184607 RepID=K6UM94_9MICO|nr:hypothetical protein [Austwickia chelonae]GAB77916.1 hypothetical protein AUCHE_08_01590 [Austwickia chelonae NBRC 105200]SEV92178.1 hypothetical protein SAMN05421595_0427 [Austwickia chelonae]